MIEKLTSEINGTNFLSQKETSKFKELYFNAPLPYQSLNDDGTFKEVNFAWFNTLGYTRDEVIGKSFRDFLHPESQPVFDENFPLFKKRGYVNGVQFKIRHKNMSYLQIVFDGCIGYDNNGKFVQTYCIFKNITENKILENKIAKNQYYLKKAQEIGKIGTWELNLKSNSLVWTEENFKIFGIPIDSEISYDVFLNCVYPPDREHVNEQWEQALNNNHYDIEHRILVDGKIKWVKEKADITYDENGIPISAIGFAQDITDRKEAEVNLLESEQRFRMVFESANVGKSITLPSGEIEVNQAFCDMLGYTREELQNKKWQEITPPDEVTEIEKRLQPIMEGQADSTRIEKRYIHKNGQHIWADLSIRLLRGLNNEPLYFINTVTDISKQKLAEEELRLSEERFKALHNASFGGIVIHDKGNFVDCNHGLSELTGYTQEELAGMNVLDLIAPSNREFVNEKMLSRAEKPFESVGLHKTGKEFPVRIEARNIPYKGKTVSVAEFRDISEQKKSAEEQIKSLNLLNNLATQVPGVVYQYRLYADGRSAFPYSSRGMWDIYEVTPEEVQEDASPVFTRIHPDDYDYIVKTITESAKNQTNYESEFRVILPKQGLRWRYCNAKPEILEDGSTLWHGIITDVTERKLAEEDRQKSEKQYRTLFETMTQGVVYQIAGGEIISANPAAEKILGLSLAQMTGMKSIDPRWKAVDENKNTLPGDKHPAMVALQTGKEVNNFTQGIFNPKKDEYVWILVNSIPQFKGNEKKAHQVFSTFLDITERKKAGEELLTSEERFRAMVEGAPDPIFIQTDFHFSYLNKPAMRLFGAKTEAELLGKSVMDRFHNDSQISIKERIIQLNEKQQAVTQLAELKIITLQGKEVWVETSGEPIFYHGKQGGLVFVRDITERKKAEEELSHSHDLMRYIIEHDQNAIAVYDKNMNNIYVSQRYLNDYRVKDKNIIGKNHYEVFPDMPEKWKEVHRRALSGEVLSSEEDYFVRTDGSVDWTRWECRPWHEADGSIGGMIAYTEVINEQKRKEEEIKKLNHRLEILIDSIQQLSIAHSLDKVQDIVAKAARKLIGSDWATFIIREGEYCSYVNEDAIQPLWKGKKFPINSCISGWVMKNKMPVVIEDVTSDERIPHDIYSSTFIKSLAVVPVNISEPIGAIGNYWKEKYMPTENELQLLQTLADASGRAIENINFYTELEERVKQRTEQLQTVNKELETFTYSVSHDLKAPLRGIDGYSKLLLDEYGENLNEEATHFIKTIRSSTLQMNRLIEDLLSYSQFERSHFRQERISLKSFVEMLNSNFSEEIKKDQFEVDIIIPEVEIMADSTCLSIALRNLIENAIKFTREKPNPKLEISFSEKPEAWIITVKDNGVGFDMKYHNRVFEIFQRLHRAEDFPGTGIGLAMVAKALQRMNGKAWAESIPGQGSTFFIEIPKIKLL